MADFCKQCSINLFGKDFCDMANISSEQNTKDEMYARVLCEGCGLTLVDHTGKCLGNCMVKEHGNGQAG